MPSPLMVRVLAPLAFLLVKITRPEQARFYRINDLAAATYRKKDWTAAKALAQEGLAFAERFPNDWNYGNAIHNGNQLLGLVCLQEGNIEAAKEHLILAGRTPGSPQLNSFGPQMILARELLKRGERDVVSQYVDLVASFWTVYKPAKQQQIPGYEAYMHKKKKLIKQWKKDIRSGKVPAHNMWLSEL